MPEKANLSVTRLLHQAISVTPFIGYSSSTWDTSILDAIHFDTHTLTPYLAESQS